MEGLIMGTKPLFISTPRGDKIYRDTMRSTPKVEFEIHGVNVITEGK